MADIFDDVQQALDDLGAAIEAVTSFKGDFVDNFGWNSSILTKDEIAERAYDLARRIEKIPEGQRKGAYVGWLEIVPAKVKKFTTQIVPNFASTNATVCSSMMEQLMCFIEGRLPPQNWPIEWQAAAEAGQMPSKLARRLRSLETNLNALEPRAGSLSEKVTRIEEAHDAAESLPLDLATLAEAKEIVKKTTDELAQLSAAAKTERTNVGVHSERIVAQSFEADKLMGNIDAAYRASTSKALADAFAKRSFWLQVQTWVFVALLILALALGGLLGFMRVSKLESLLTDNQNISIAVLWMNVVISFLSVAAPVWFAWIATKQITQRFKLAEDYGFKAAVATAYEGYRREAANVDPLFVTRLFGSALARLEEAPLRLIDEENYGSPFHELTASPGFRDAIGLIPALKDKYASILQSMASKVREGAQEAASEGVAAAVALNRPRHKAEDRSAAPEDE